MVEEVRAVGKAWTEVRVGATSVVIRRKLLPPLEIPFAEISRIHSKLPGRMNGYLAFETARGGRNPGPLGVETELRHVRFIVHFGREAAGSIDAVKRTIEERTEVLRQRGAIPAALPAPTWAEAEKAKRKREIKVVEYKDRKAFEKDAKKMLANGWEITSTNLNSIENPVVDIGEAPHVSSRIVPDERANLGAPARQCLDEMAADETTRAGDQHANVVPVHFLARIRDTRTRPRDATRELFIDPRAQNNLPVVVTLTEHASGPIDLREQLSVLCRQSDLGNLSPLPYRGLQSPAKWFQPTFRYRAHEYRGVGKQIPNPLPQGQKLELRQRVDL